MIMVPVISLFRLGAFLFNKGSMKKAKSSAKTCIWALICPNFADGHQIHKIASNPIKWILQAAREFL